MDIRGWMPEALRQKVLAWSQVRRIHRGRQIRVGWGLFCYLTPRLIWSMDTVEIARRRAEVEELIVIVPAAGALGKGDLTDVERSLLKRIPWWQRVILAAGLRPVDRVVPVRSFDPGRFIADVGRECWLGRLDGPIE